MSTVGKGLAQGLYVATRAGVEPTTLRSKVIASTNAPPRSTWYILYSANITANCILESLSSVRRAQHIVQVFVDQILSALNRPIDLFTSSALEMSCMPS